MIRKRAIKSAGAVLSLSEEMDAVNLRSDRWAEADRLLTLAQLLPPNARDILFAVLKDGLSLSAAADLLGLSWGKARRLYEAAIRRLNGEPARRVLRHLMRLALAERELAVGRFLGGLSYRKLAGQLGVSIYQVRTRLADLRFRLEELDRQSGRCGSTGSSRRG